MSKTYVDKFVENNLNKRLFLQERAIYEVTCKIEELMAEKGISRSKLADMLGKSRGWVTQLLDGESNKTIRTVADVFAVLGQELHFDRHDIRISNSTTPDITIEILSSQCRGESATTTNMSFDFKYSVTRECSPSDLVEAA